MRWLRDEQSPGWMVRAASTAAESHALEGEVEVLRGVAHPGVVELGAVTTGPDGLLAARTRYVGPSLDQLGPLPPAEVAGLGAALATVLADIHDLGRAHGRLGPDHVLLDPSGRPVLCGFGSERARLAPAPAGAASAADEDVEALRRLLSGCLDGPAPARLARLLAPPGRRHRALSARALADALARCQPEARLPVVARSEGALQDEPQRHIAPPKEPTPQVTPPLSSRLVKRHPLRAVADDGPEEESGRGPVAAAVAALVLIFVIGGAVTWTFTRHHHAASTTACPATDEGCTPIAVHDGVFVTAAGRFAVDLKSVVIVVGRWGCRDEGLPAALDPATGQVWAWTTWPGSKVLSARTLSHVAGASGLAVLPEASGCDRLIVRRGRAAPVVLQVTSRA